MDTKLNRSVDKRITAEPETCEEGPDDDYYQSIIDECPDGCEGCEQIDFHMDFCAMFL